MSSPSIATARGACATPTPPSIAARISATPTAAYLQMKNPSGHRDSSEQNAGSAFAQVASLAPRRDSAARRFADGEPSGGTGGTILLLLLSGKDDPCHFEPHATSFSMANAQILAQAAAMAYREPALCAKWAKASGFTGAFDFFDNADTQGFVVEGDDTIIVAFRGTQPNRPMDWFVDFRATRGHWDHNIGEVHDGFYNALRKVWGVTLANGEVLRSDSSTEATRRSGSPDTVSAAPGRAVRGAGDVREQDSRAGRLHVRAAARRQQGLRRCRQ
jgi:hypothetical protein